MAVLLFGDSLAENVTLAPFATIAGHAGATTDDLLYGFPHLDFYLAEDEYAYVILIAGTNDLSTTGSSTRIIDNLLHMGAKARMTGARVIACTLLNDDFNELYRERAPADTLWCTFFHEDMDTTYLADDGVHLSDEGERDFSHMLLKIVEDDSKKDK